MGFGVRLVIFVFFGLSYGCTGAPLRGPAPDRALYAETAKRFEADSTLHVQEEALYEAGLAYALPDSPVHDPDRALVILERLVDLHPKSVHGIHATQLLELLRESASMREELRLRDAEMEAIHRRLEEERGRVEEVERRLDAERARADGLQAIADRLNQELLVRIENLRALEEELNALKEIDLNRPLPGPAMPSRP